MLGKHQDLNLDLQYPLKEPYVATCASEPNAGEVEPRDFLGLIGQPVYGALRYPVSKYKVEKKLKKIAKNIL